MVFCQLFLHDPVHLTLSEWRCSSRIRDLAWKTAKNARFR